MVFNIHYIYYILLTILYIYNFHKTHLIFPKFNPTLTILLECIALLYIWHVHCLQKNIIYTFLSSYLPLCAVQLFSLLSVTTFPPFQSQWRKQGMKSLSLHQSVSQVEELHPSKLTTWKIMSQMDMWATFDSKTWVRTKVCRRQKNHIL